MGNVNPRKAGVLLSYVNLIINTVKKKLKKI